MSRYIVTAIERMGDPGPEWASVYGITGPYREDGVTPLRTLDLTPYYEPLAAINQTMERTLLKASLGGIKIDLKDTTGALVTKLGPYVSDTASPLCTATRYYGPWIKVEETDGTTTSTVFFGYLDETSLEWDEDNKLTRFSVLAAIQLLKGRKLQDYPQFKRPLPAIPQSVAQTFTAGNADDMMHTLRSDYTQRTDKVAIETALWQAGKLSWKAYMQAYSYTITEEGPYGIPLKSVKTNSFDAPKPPSGRVVINGRTYNIVGQQDVLTYTIPGTGPDDFFTYAVTALVLSGVPLDLTQAPTSLTAGTSISFYQSEAERTHYVLQANIPAPAADTDGQRFLILDTVDQLAVGDPLTMIFPDASNNGRRTTLTLTVIEIDGETGTVHVLEPINQAITAGAYLKIRRATDDPVFVDAAAYAQKVVAPFTLDTSQLFIPQVTRQIVSWVSLDNRTITGPRPYGIHDIQVLTRATTQGGGKFRLSRRGGKDGSGNFTAAGCYEGTYASGFTWVGTNPFGDTSVTDAKLMLNQYLNLTQFPVGWNDLPAPLLYVQGDLSGGATQPPNGWRGGFRTWKSLLSTKQDLWGRWDGTNVIWTKLDGSGVGGSTDTPAKMVWGTAQVITPCRYELAGTTWKYQKILASKNFLKYSQDFENAVWGKEGGVSVAANSALAPDGTYTADVVTMTAGNGIYQSSTTPAANGTGAYQDVWLRCATPTQFKLAMNRVGGFDGEEKTITVGPTWTKYSMSHTNTWTGTTNMQPYFRPVSGGAVVEMWGWRANTGTFAGTPGGVPPEPYYQRTGASIQATATPAGYLDTLTTFTPGGTLPTGGFWYAMGMGIRKQTSKEAEEMVIGLYANATAMPFTSMRICTFSCDDGGGLTLIDNLDAGAATPNAGSSGVWSTGGGLVFRTWTQTINNIVYPMTDVFYPNGAGGLTKVTLEGVEAIPSACVPRGLVGTLGNRQVAGWYLLALQTYQDGDNFAVSRRLRFIQLNASLVVENGSPYPILAAPDDRSQDILLGEVIADPCPDGSQVCKMVRTGFGNEIFGFFGQRMFISQTYFPLMLERVKISAGMDALRFLEDLGTALLATAVSTPSGGVKLISRQAGVIRSRATGVGGHIASALPDEIMDYKSRPVSQATVGEVRIKYNNAVTGKAKEAVVLSTSQGGKPMEVNLESVVASETQAGAIAAALADYFGPRCPAKTVALRDGAPAGLQADLPAPFWATWGVGDRWIDDTVQGTSAFTWKITKIDWNLDNRRATIEVTRLPYQEIVN